MSERNITAKALLPCQVCGAMSGEEAPAREFVLNLQRALTEIAFANFDGGPTPDYIREHARKALKVDPFPKDETGEQ